MSTHRFLRMLEVAGWVIVVMLLVATGGLVWLIWWLVA